MIMNEMYDLSACANVPKYTFLIAIIDNVNNSCRDLKKKCSEQQTTIGSFDGDTSVIKQ